MWKLDGEEGLLAVLVVWSVVKDVLRSIGSKDFACGRSLTVRC